MYNSALFVAALASLAAADVMHPHRPRAVTNTALQTTFPTSSGTTNIAAAKTIAASITYDGGMKVWDRSSKCFMFETVLSFSSVLIASSQHLRGPDRDW